MAWEGKEFGSQRRLACGPQEERKGAGGKEGYASAALLLKVWSQGPPTAASPVSLLEKQDAYVYQRSSEPVHRFKLQDRKRPSRPWQDAQMPGHSLSQEAESVVHPGVFSPLPGVKGPQIEPPASAFLSSQCALTEWCVGRPTLPALRINKAGATYPASLTHYICRAFWTSNPETLPGFVPCSWCLTEKEKIRC